MTADIGIYYSDPWHENMCGLTMRHAFAILAAFELKGEDQKVVHRLIMIRNPRNINHYFGKWNNRDTFSWNPNFIKQVPFGYDPLTT